MRAAAACVALSLASAVGCSLPASEIEVTAARAAAEEEREAEEDAGPPEECEECKCADKDADGKSIYDRLKSLKLGWCSSPAFACKLSKTPNPATYVREYCEYTDREQKTGCGIKYKTETYECPYRYKPECEAHTPEHYPVLECKESEYETGTPPMKVKYCGVAKHGQVIKGPQLSCERDPPNDYKGSEGYELYSTCTWAVDDADKGTCLGTCSLARYVPDLVKGGCKRDTASSNVIDTSFACENKVRSSEVSVLESGVETMEIDVSRLDRVTLEGETSADAHE